MFTGRDLFECVLFFAIVFFCSLYLVKHEHLKGEVGETSKGMGGKGGRSQRHLLAFGLMLCVACVAATLCEYEANFCLTQLRQLMTQNGLPRLDILGAKSGLRVRLLSQVIAEASELETEYDSIPQEIELK